jgi:hypothetical protein
MWGIPGKSRWQAGVPSSLLFSPFRFEFRAGSRHSGCVQRASLFLLAAVLFLAATLNVSAQGTAISYQGRLNASGAPANTNFDFRFAVFNAPTNGSMVSIWLTNYDVPVSNGLFSVILDFGPGVFNGTSNGSNDWLDIAVRPTGTTSFTPLVPRQPILPVPYALFATSASNLLGTLQATQLVGTALSSLISGTYSNTVNFVNGTNTFAGMFSGNGVGLTNLNASYLATGTVADARLPADVALLGQNQVFTGSNAFAGPATFAGPNAFNGAVTFTGPNTFTGTGTYTGVNTFTNNGNYFIGSFFGNGLVGWLPLAATSTNAMRDAGYLTLNASLSTVTLPTTASLSVGDIVRVSGGGGGGWLVKENTGQWVIGNLAAYRNCYLSTPLVGTACYGVAAAADGLRMYAVGVQTPSSGSGINGIQASSDGGQTWTLQLGGLTGSWYSVACSADGKIVYAQKYGGGTIQMSTDGGYTWANSSYSTTGGEIACSADGSKVFAANTTSYACSGNGTYVAELSGNKLWYSINGGSAWTQITTVPSGTLGCLGASSDCTRMVLGVSNGLLYASSNLGANWTSLTISNQFWSGAWMSPDGTKLAAAASTSGGLVGGVFTASVTPRPNTISTNSTICGSQGSAVELQHVGNGQFIPVGSSGVLWAN